MLYPHINIETEAEVNKWRAQYAYFRKRKRARLTHDQKAIDYVERYAKLEAARAKLENAWMEISDHKEILDLIANGDPLANLRRK